jgi:hypothetical protein
MKPELAHVLNECSVLAEERYAGQVLSDEGAAVVLMRIEHDVNILDGTKGKAEVAQGMISYAADILRLAAYFRREDPSVPSVSSCSVSGLEEVP